MSSSLRFQMACRMLRLFGGPGFDVDKPLPSQKKGESPIDWLVRLGLAKNAHLAAEMLIVGQNLKKTLDEVESDPAVRDALE